ncbi:hypothetical protein Bbelb_421250 [Branchiostoma belcheri]|nr:hypothetical protein Bbelb_421250 [Branchiostoma belcheri]
MAALQNVSAGGLSFEGFGIAQESQPGTPVSIGFTSAGSVQDEGPGKSTQSQAQSKSSRHEIMMLVFKVQVLQARIADPHDVMEHEACFGDVYSSIWSYSRQGDQWRQVAQCFQERLNFPHVCGAIDGKHVAIKKPKKSGTLRNYNYKGSFSVVILAVVDASYKFLWVDFGTPGSDSDCGMCNRSHLPTKTCNLHRRLPV